MSFRALLKFPPHGTSRPYAYVACIAWDVTHNFYGFSISHLKSTCVTLCIKFHKIKSTTAQISISVWDLAQTKRRVSAPKVVQLFFLSFFFFSSQPEMVRNLWDKNRGCWRGKKLRWDNVNVLCRREMCGNRKIKLQKKILNLKIIFFKLFLFIKSLSVSQLPS